jgi:hypothetical protein
VERLESIFKIDMDADLMAEILLVIVNMWEKKNIIISETPEQEHTQEKEKGIEEKEEIFALKTLEALSSTRRFSLNLDFLDNNQLEVIQKVFRLIEDKARKNNDNGDDDDTLLSRLQLLKSTYKIL